MARWDSARARPVYRSVNACLAPLYSVAGAHVLTVEGIGSEREGLHPVQRQLACSHGSQCGFCTPGFVMSMYTLLRSREPGAAGPGEHAIETNLAGNLCRCTGYRPILDAFRPFAAAAVSEAGGGGAAAAAAAADKVEPPRKAPRMAAETLAKEAAAAEQDPLTGVREVPFPDELQRVDASSSQQQLTLRGAAAGGAVWHRPVSLGHMLELKRELGASAKIVCGNTEVGIEVMMKGVKFAHIIAGTHVPELCAVEERSGGVTLGSSVTLSELEEVCRRQIESRPPHETQAFAAVLRQLHWFAGRQIRNVASIGGNVVTGSPISDLNPLWMACGSTH